MEGVNSITKMVGSTRDNGVITSWTVMESSTTMEVTWPTRDNGDMMSFMVRGRSIMIIQCNYRGRSITLISSICKIIGSITRECW